MPIIELRGVTKRYGQLTAVDDLTLAIEEGEIFGFVGPNGAGKTTTLRMIATLLQPTKGEILVAGSSARTHPGLVRRAIGYMPDFPGVYDDTKVWEFLDFFAACHEIPEPHRTQLIDDLLELVELSHRREDMVETLSRGMKQRLSLARALVHDPQILVLDEPAAGLDPRARVEMRELLMELRRLGKTVFFSTHVLSDVAQIATRVGIIEAGRLVAVGTIQELSTTLAPQRVVRLGLLDGIEQAMGLLRAMQGVHKVDSSLDSTDGRGEITLEFTGDDNALSAMMASLVGQGIPIVHFSEVTRDLEQVFLRATKGIVS